MQNFFAHHAVQAYQRHSQTISVFLLNLTLGLLCAAPLILRFHLSPDSFGFDSEYVLSHLSVGRYTNALILQVTLSLGLHPVVHQQIFMVFWVLCSALAITALTKVFVPARATDRRGLLRLVLTDIILSMVFFNVLIMDCMFFPEVAQYAAIGNLILALAVCFTLRKSVIQKIVGFLFLLLAFGVGQNYLGVYFCLVISAHFALFVKQRNIKSLVFGGLIAGAFSFLGGIANIGIQKLSLLSDQVLELNRGASFSPELLKENIVSIIQYHPKLYLGPDNLMPGTLFWYAVVFFVVMLVCTFIYTGIKKWSAITVAPRVALTGLALFILGAFLGYLAVFAPYIVAHDQGYAPRILFSLYAWIAGFLLLPTLTLLFEAHRVNLPLTSIFASGACAFLLLQSLCIQDMSLDVLNTNAADRETALLVYERIDEYERENNTEITHLAAVHDAKVTWLYPDTRYLQLSSAIKAYPYPYVAINLINYYSGRSFIMAEEIPASIKQSFSQQDWNELNLDAQLVFKGSTAYWAIY